MKIFLKKIIFLLAIMSITALMFAVCASAAGDTKLYKHGTIEWTIDTATGVVTVHPTENGNGVAHFEDLYSSDWKTFSQILYKDVITEIKIENVEGRTPITKITGGFTKINTLTKVTFPSTVIAIGEREGGWAFASESILTAGVEGTPEGTIDFTGITTAWDGYSHQYLFTALPAKTILLPNIESVIVKNMFNAIPQLKELTIPENVTAVSSGAFAGCLKLNKVTVSGAATNFAADAFNECTRMYTIVGHKDSSAYECAKKNGYEFVDITTGKVILEGTVELGPDPDTVWPWVREEADDGGNLYQEYMGARLIDTYWAWYADEKTLVFFDNIPSGYNETGATFAESDSGTHWVNYKDVCEKIAVEGSIDKITGGAFADFKALKLVQIGGTEQIDKDAFLNCTSLTSIYRAYEHPKEGVADLTTVWSLGSNILTNTGIETVMLKSDAKVVNDTAFMGCKNLIAEPTEFFIQYAKDNFFNLINVNNPDEVYEHYMKIDPTKLIQAGTSATAIFDEETGTLTILGSGEIYGITNYYGGGSKKQPWFSFRKDIKKVVIGSKITEIGKYAFCQLVNLEEVELPSAAITIGNAAFEKCYNLKSVYVAGNKPIEGTFDLRNVSEIGAWMFAYTYLLANPIISPDVVEIDDTAFEDCMNIASFYGTAGSYAETYAAEKGKTFVDVSAGMPAAVTCTPPEMNQDEKEKAERDAEKTETTEPTETTYEEPDFVIEPDDTMSEGDETVVVPGTSNTNGGSDNTMVIIIAAAIAIVVVAAVLVVVLMKKKKK